MTVTQSMQGKIVLVTGATNGIGEVTARSLAGKGATVILVGRNPEKTAATAQGIRAATGNEQVDCLVADLSVQSQVQQLAQDFQKKYDRLDVLVNNAGAVFMSRQVSADGIEMTLALNHFNYFILTHHLLAMLTASAPARIVNVSSEAHRGARLNFSDLQNEHGYSAMKAYGQSKLANLYFTYGLAAQLDGSGVTVNALHPGFVASGFGKNNGRLIAWAMGLVQLAAISPAEGAETSIYLASSPEVEGVSGKYFTRCRAVPSSPVSYDMSAARKLWDCSLEMTGLPALA
jgi:retinol dehydrogenase 12